jgi:ankyrin repeat protein
MCRAEIFTEDCNKVEQTLATVTHRRQVDFKKRKKEKDKYERVQLKKEKEERLFLLKKEQEERDKREEAHVLGLADVAQRQAEEVARTMLQQKANSEKNKLLQAKKRETKRKKKSLKLKHKKINEGIDEDTQAVSRPEKKKKKKVQKRPKKVTKTRQERPRAQKNNSEKKCWKSMFSWYTVGILLLVVLAVCLKWRSIDPTVRKRLNNTEPKVVTKAALNANERVATKESKSLSTTALKLALFNAVANGKIHTVIDLMETNDIDVNSPLHSREDTLLSFACQHGYIELVQYLLRVADIQINLGVTTGYAPLTLACYQGHTDVVRLLLEQKSIDPNKVVHDGATPLYIACHGGQFAIVKLLLKKEGIQINQATETGTTPLMAACHGNHIEIVQALLNMKDVQVNQVNKMGATPLMMACQQDAFDTVQVLLEHDDIDVTIMSSSGNYALNYAVHISKDKRILNLLHQHLEMKKITATANNKQLSHSESLTIASKNGDLGAVKELYHKYTIDVNVQIEEDGVTILMIASAYGHLNLTRYLLQFTGVQINLDNNNGITALFLACQYGRVDVVNVLLARKEIWH